MHERLSPIEDQGKCAPPSYVFGCFLGVRRPLTVAEISAVRTGYRSQIVGLSFMLKWGRRFVSPHCAHYFENAITVVVVSLHQLPPPLRLVSLNPGRLALE